MCQWIVIIDLEHCVMYIVLIYIYILFFCLKIGYMLWKDTKLILYINTYFMYT